MPGVYVDTSALARVLLDDPGRRSIERAFEAFDERVSSELLLVELRRVALRTGLRDDVDELLRGIALAPLDQTILEQAGTVNPASVATLDAIHLVTALNLAEAGLVEALMTYDRRLAAGAREHGLRVVAPD